VVKIRGFKTLCTLCVFCEQPFSFARFARCAKIGGERGIRTLVTLFRANTLSKRAHSTTLPPLHDSSERENLAGFSVKINRQRLISFALKSTDVLIGLFALARFTL
jgi:hypothetical protein